ncbi:hypothetical protein CWE15_10325 [Aliidiomarina taiwanensis]|uniref:Uncharacterized protein n=1 Tax=Aliidiomarina taiwanensis TaxID=946228 RepID=A0A432WYN7_9GAMM|nr:hypothetical protein [Aliidiomarina taiwanensis]RUO38893.1 hypothetical protein CWE15_10325 [Aliidiomarina taiwanensis]
MKKNIVFIGAVLSLTLYGVSAVHKSRDLDEQEIKSKSHTQVQKNTNIALKEEAFINERHVAEPLVIKNTNNSAFVATSGNDAYEALGFVDFVKHKNFTALADQHIFMHSEGAINYESKTFIANRFNDFVIEAGLTGGLVLEYNECSTDHCIVSIAAQALGQEQFDVLTQEALFGTLAEVSPSGGHYAVVDEGDLKYLRVFYALGQ